MLIVITLMLLCKIISLPVGVRKEDAESIFRYLENVVNNNVTKSKLLLINNSGKSELVSKCRHELTNIFRLLKEPSIELSSMLKLKQLSTTLLKIPTTRIARAMEVKPFTRKSLGLNLSYVRQASEWTPFEYGKA